MATREELADKLYKLTGYTGRCNEIRGNRNARKNALSTVDDYFKEMQRKKKLTEEQQIKANEFKQQLTKVIIDNIPEQTPHQDVLMELWTNMSNHYFFLTSGTEPDKHTRDAWKYNGDRQANYEAAKKDIVHSIGDSEELQRLFQEYETHAKVYFEFYGKMDDHNNDRGQWKALYDQQNTFEKAHKDSENALTNYILEVNQ